RPRVTRFSKRNRQVESTCHSRVDSKAISHFLFGSIRLLLEARPARRICSVAPCAKSILHSRSCRYERSRNILIQTWIFGSSARARLYSPSLADLRSGWLLWVSTELKPIRSRGGRVRSEFVWHSALNPARF